MLSFSMSLLCMRVSQMQAIWSGAKLLADAPMGRCPRLPRLLVVTPPPEVHVGRSWEHWGLPPELEVKF